MEVLSLRASTHSRDPSLYLTPKPWSPEYTEPQGSVYSGADTVFVLEVVPPQRRVYSFFFHKSRESHISTLLYTVSSSAQHFPPVPPAPMGHPRPPGADRSRSGFIQGQRAPVVLLSRPSTRPERGNHGPP